MARPQKNNLDYFSHDCDMRNDIKIKALRRKFGHKGYSLYVMMLEHLGKCDYLCYEWTPLNIELLTPDFDVDSAELIEFINYATDVLKLFEIKNNHIVCPNQMLRAEPLFNDRKGFSWENSPIMKFTEDLSSKSEINSVIRADNTQSKVKESKVKESILNESIVKESTVQKTKQNIDLDIVVPLVEEKIPEHIASILKIVLEDGNITSKQRTTLNEHKKKIIFQIPVLEQILEKI